MAHISKNVVRIVLMRLKKGIVTTLLVVSKLVIQLHSPLWD